MSLLRHDISFPQQETEKPRKHVLSQKRTSQIFDQIFVRGAQRIPTKEVHMKKTSLFGLFGTEKLDKDFVDVCS